MRGRFREERRAVRLLRAETATDVGKVNMATIAAIVSLAAAGRLVEALFSIAKGTLSVSTFKVILVVALVGLSSMAMLVLLEVVKNLESWLVAGQARRSPGDSR